MPNWVEILLRRSGAIGAGLVVLIVAVLVLWWVPVWQVEQQVGSLDEESAAEEMAASREQVTQKDKSTLINEYRRTIAQILGGFGLLIGIYFTWRTLTNSETSQITERFTRAVDQIGSTDDKGQKRLELRLGGIYALERIARDSERDHWTVMEILTTYIRTNSPREKADWSISYPPKVPSADIQAIVYVLGRRDITREQREDKRLNLNGTNLRGADLRGANLEGASFVEAQLEGAYLTKARLKGADLTGTPLQNADLRRAHLENTSVHNADMTETDVRGTDLRRISGLARWQIGVMVKDDSTRFPKNVPNDTPDNLFGG